MRRQTLLIALGLALCLIPETSAEHAASFFDNLKKYVTPGQTSENGRQGRQTCAGPLCFTFSLNGVTNFTFPITSIPDTFPIVCGGDDRNYCNYPDLPLIETYDLNYYSRRPIPSGRCPDGYTKMATFDCLNIAPALFETTCCVFLSTAPTAICPAATSPAGTMEIDAFFTLCNGSVYLTSGAYAWRLDQNLAVVQGPILLAALTGGAISRDLSEAEVDGNCNVQFFNLADQYYVTNFADGSLATTGPNLVSQLCLPGTPQYVYSNGNRGTLIYKVDGDLFHMTLTDGYNFLCGDNTTCSIQVRPPGEIASSPLINATAATYLPSRDLLAFIYDDASGVNTVKFCRRSGNCTGFTATALTALLCPTVAAAAATQTAPLVYIPYPVYPIFAPQSQSPQPSAPAPGAAPGSQSYSYAPSPMSPAPSSSSYSYSG